MRAQQNQTYRNPAPSQAMQESVETLIREIDANAALDLLNDWMLKCHVLKEPMSEREQAAYLYLTDFLKDLRDVG